MRGSLLVIAAGAAIACPVIASAQDRPAIVPTKDVTVEYSYKMTPKTGAPREGRATIISAAGGKQMRVEGFGPPGYMIIDREAGRSTMVMDAQHMYMEMPFDPARAGPFVMRENMQFARKGSDTVAGVKCTVWETHGDQGTGSACITDDGVLLRGEADGRNGQAQLTATSVSYAPLSDSEFQAPAGYQKMQMPTMPPGVGRPGMPPKQTP